MKLLFLGGSFPETQENDIYNLTKGVYDFAANILQKKLVSGFKKHLGNNFYYLSVPFVNPFPMGYKKMYYKGIKYSKNEIYLSFLNIWGIRNISRYFHLYLAAKKYLKITDEEKYIIVYSPHVPFLKTAVRLKKKNKNIKIILLLPDLPQFLSLSNKRRPIYSFFKKFDIKQFYKYSEYFDSYILLTKYMNEFVNKDMKKKYMVLEGVVNDNYYKNFIEKKNNDDGKFHITYTGTLHEAFGIKKLVSSFMKFENKNYVLNICGAGDSEKYIEECCEKDSRIKYYGQVSNDVALSLQLISDVLINPRNNSGIFTKYSFPSKNLEYLSSGVLVIAYKLAGIPDEYDEILFYPNDNSSEALMKKIDEIYNMTSKKREKHLIKTSTFLETKTTDKSIEKILEFMRSE